MMDVMKQNISIFSLSLPLTFSVGWYFKIF